jgi:F0F1-type ATP synthase membrane subunit b/b'
LDWLNKEKRKDQIQIEKEKEKLISELKKYSKEDLFQKPKKLTLWQKIRMVIWGH